MSLPDPLTELSAELRGPLEAAAGVARDQGIELYLVGGFVRDLLLGRQSRDLDLVVVGDESAFAEGLASALGAEPKAHPEFLTATLELPGDLRIDVARARDESYPRPGALPEVRPANLARDLGRRDFSVNAIALRLAPDPAGEWIDPCGGRSDLESGLLRALHPGSFVDDPTRLFRGLELEGRLGLRLEGETEGWARQAIAQGGLQTLSAERRGRELLAALGGCGPETVSGRLAELGVLAALVPSLHYGEAERRRLRLVSRSTRQLAPEGSEVGLLLLTALALDLEEGERKRLAVALALSGARAEILAAGPNRVAAVAAELNDPGLSAHRAFEALEGPPAELLPLLAAREEGPVRRWLERYLDEMKDLALSVSGRDLVELGFDPGPGIGEALLETRRARLDGELSASDELAFAAGWLRRAPGEGETDDR